MSQRSQIDFYNQSIATEEALSTFVVSLSGPVLAGDDSVALGAVLNADDELWKSSTVRKAVQRTQFSNQNLRIGLNLLISDSVTPEQELSFDVLLGRGNSHFFKTVAFANFLWRLHRRGVIDAEALFAHRLHWYTSRALWKTAILVLRVCRSKRLENQSFQKMAAKKWRQFELFLHLSSDPGADPEGIHKLRNAVLVMVQSKEFVYTDLVLKLSWICSLEGGSLARRIVKELISLNEFRRIEYFIPFISNDEAMGGQTILLRLADSPNRVASELANIELKRGSEKRS